MSTATGKTTRTPTEQAAYVADYRFGWTVYSPDTPYTAMNSDGEKDGWASAWEASLRESALAKIQASALEAAEAAMMETLHEALAVLS